jgi:hypothetical protein
MKRNGRYKALVACALLVGATLVQKPLFAAEPDWSTLLERMDELGNFGDSDFSAEITVVSKKDGKGDSTFIARYFRRDAGDKFTIVMLAPESVKGQGYSSAGKDLWYYDPESRKFAFWSLKDSFRDSVAQNSDFSSSKFAKEYTLTEHALSTLGSYDVYEITLVAKNTRVPVAKRKMWIRADSAVPLKEEQYSVSGRLLRTIAYAKYQTVAGKEIPESMLIVNNLKAGEKTQITFSNPAIAKLPDEVFTKEYLALINHK